MAVLGLNSSLIRASVFGIIALSRGMFTFVSILCVVEGELVWCESADKVISSLSLVLAVGLVNLFVRGLCVVDIDVVVVVLIGFVVVFIGFVGVVVVVLAVVVVVVEVVVVGGTVIGTLPFFLGLPFRSTDNIHGGIPENVTLIDAVGVRRRGRCLKVGTNLYPVCTCSAPPSTSRCQDKSRVRA